MTKSVTPQPDAGQGATDRIAAKRAVVVGGGGGKTLHLPLIALVVVALGVLGFLGWRLMPAAETERAHGQQFDFVPTTGQVSHALAALPEGKAVYYQHKAPGGVFIRYFLCKTDGEVTAAIDACELCGEDRLGHGQRGDKLVCQKCDLGFDLAKIDDAHAAGEPCAPLVLPHEVRDGQVILQVPDLLTGTKYFAKPAGS